MVTGFDYQYDPLTAKERLAFVGNSLSTDMMVRATAIGYSSFIVYEDAANYRQIWAREVKRLGSTYVDEI